MLFLTSSFFHSFEVLAGGCMKCLAFAVLDVAVALFRSSPCEPVSLTEGSAPPILKIM